MEDPRVACHGSSRHERPLAERPAGPALTRCSSISISPALSTMGPRTAYSTAFTWGFMDSRVRMRSRGLRSGRTLSVAEASAAALLWLRPQGPRRTSTAARCIANLPRLTLAQKEREQDIAYSPGWAPVPQEPKALGQQRQPSTGAGFPPPGYRDPAPRHCSTKTLHRWVARAAPNVRMQRACRHWAARTAPVKVRLGCSPARWPATASWRLAPAPPGSLHSHTHRCRLRLKPERWLLGLVVVLAVPTLL